MTPANCRESAIALEEPLAGTAPQAQAWVLVEHPGPWPAQAFYATGITERMRSQWGAWPTAGVRVLLIRRPDRPLRSDDGYRHVFAAHSETGRLVELSLEAPDIGRLAELDPYHLARGDLTALGGSVSLEPLVAVCTHGARDACCATVGRPMLQQAIAASTNPSRIWESSHIGGHRFSPVALCLPSGVVLGRTSAAAVKEALAERFLPASIRGRAHQPPRIQAAEAAVYVAHPDVDLTRLTSWGDADGPVRVSALDGRTWQVEVKREVCPPHPESCGGLPVETTVWRSTLIA